MPGLMRGTPDKAFDSRGRRSLGRSSRRPRARRRSPRPRAPCGTARGSRPWSSATRPRTRAASEECDGRSFEPPPGERESDGDDRPRLVLDAPAKAAALHEEFRLALERARLGGGAHDGGLLGGAKQAPADAGDRGAAVAHSVLRFSTKAHWSQK